MITLRDTLADPASAGSAQALIPQLLATCGVRTAVVPPTVIQDTRSFIVPVEDRLALSIIRLPKGVTLLSSIFSDPVLAPLLVGSAAYWVLAYIVRCLPAIAGIGGKPRGSSKSDDVAEVCLPIVQYLVIVFISHLCSDAVPYGMVP